MVCRLVMFCGSVDVMEEQLLSCRYLHSSPVETAQDVSSIEPVDAVYIQ